MTDIKKVLDSMKDLNNDEAIDKLVKMVKSGEAGISSSQAITLANRILPMIEKSQQDKVRKLIKKLKSLNYKAVM